MNDELLSALRATETERDALRAERDRLCKALRVSAVALDVLLCLVASHTDEFRQGMAALKAAREALGEKP